MHDPEQTKSLLLGEDEQATRPTFVARARRTLMPYKRAIHVANAALLLCYVVALVAMHHDQSAEQHLEKRIVVNGRSCPQQRKQLNVFMASFFGGIFAADQFYAKNWQLAVPKLIFFLFGAPLAGIVTAFTGIGLHFAWWIIDVVMWGVGYYTTHTYWSNPTKGCAVIGW